MDKTRDNQQQLTQKINKYVFKLQKIASKSNSKTLDAETYDAYEKVFQSVKPIAEKLQKLNKIQQETFLKLSEQANRKMA